MKARELARFSVHEPHAGAPACDVGGDVAAKVFARLDAGVCARDVVTELAVAPETVDYLWRTWARLRGTVLVSPETKQFLAAALHGLVAPRTPAELVQLAQRLAGEEQGACSRCGRGVAEYCYSCPSEAAAKARERGRRRPRRTTRRG
jgi:hypothetical protein